MVDTIWKQSTRSAVPCVTKSRLTSTRYPHLIDAIAPFWHTRHACFICASKSLQLRHNERIVVSNHEPHDWLLNQVFFQGVDHRNYQSSASLTSVWGIDRWPVNSPHQGTATRKMFEFDDVFMLGYYAWAPDYHGGIATNQADLWVFTPEYNTPVWFLWHACINKGSMWPSLSPCTVINPILLTYNYLLLA